MYFQPMKDKMHSFRLLNLTPRVWGGEVFPRFAKKESFQSRNVGVGVHTFHSRIVNTAAPCPIMGLSN